MEEAKLVELHHDSNGTTIAMQHPIVHIMAEHLSALFKSAGGQNYVSFEIDTEELGPLMLTMQRRWGETPEKQARERLARIAEQDAEIARLRTLLDTARPGTIAVPEDLAWRASTWLRVLSGVILSGEVKEAVAADQAAWFALLTEAPK